MVWKGIRSLWIQSRPSCGKPGCLITASEFSAITTRAPDRRRSTAPTRMLPANRLSISHGNSRIDDPATPNTGAGVRTYDDRGAYEYLPAGTSLPVVTTQAVHEHWTDHRHRERQ